MVGRSAWVWLLAGLAACVVEKIETGKGETAADTAADIAAGCNDGMTKEEWIEAWNLSFCTCNVKCEAWMQAHEASGSCDSAPTEAGVPYCTE
ncbi:MAG: hypothetical protein EXR71_01960 [Myxococcales bacterium]|nr:hypothetical protein [Myxococcales bacterium]